MREPGAQCVQGGLLPAMQLVCPVHALQRAWHPHEQTWLQKGKGEKEE